MNLDFEYPEMLETFNFSQFLDSFFDPTSQNMSFILHDTCEEDKKYERITEIITTKIIPTLVILGLIGKLFSQILLYPSFLSSSSRWKSKTIWINFHF